MGKRNQYSFAKRQRELKKRKKAQEKSARKLLRRASGTELLVMPKSADSLLPDPPPPFEMTEEAGEYLAGLVEQIRTPESPDVIMRLDSDGIGGHGLGTGSPRPDDINLEFAGRPVLALDPWQANDLVGRVLDIKEDDGGRLLTIRWV